MSPLALPPAHVQPTFAELSGVTVASPATVPSDRRSADPRAFPRLRATAPLSSAGHDTYVVRPGDTLLGIAARHGVSLRRLLAMNGLSSTTVIMPGRRLVIPGGRPAARNAVKARRSNAAGSPGGGVTVRPGDTVDGLSARYGVSRAAILKANGLSMASLLHPGQVLRIPGSPSTVATGTSYRNLSAAASANRRYLAAGRHPTRSQVRAMIVQTARRHGVDPRLALAIAWQESGWNQRAVSSANAVGVMQCLPSTASWVSQVVGRRLNVLDAQDSITCGVALLRTLQRSARSEREVIAAYYQGLTSVRQRGEFLDTKRYVSAVLSLKSRM